MIALVIVTHNSASMLPHCLAAVAAQTRPPDQVIIVDSGSFDNSYVKVLASERHYVSHCQENRGFAAANNKGLLLVDDTSRYILFLNPDAYMAPEAIEMAVRCMDQRPEVAVVGGRLKGFASVAGVPTGRLDSTGVFRTWYGRWYDRGRGEPDDQRYRLPEHVPAVCGAFMFCRASALAPMKQQVFDEDYFLYKEDIDMCLRLRCSGWKCLYDPSIEVYHCRGWADERRTMSRASRLQAARSEVLLTIKHRSPYLVWAISKYLLVRFANV